MSAGVPLAVEESAERKAAAVVHGGVAGSTGVGVTSAAIDAATANHSSTGVAGTTSASNTVATARATNTTGSTATAAAGTTGASNSVATATAATAATTKTKTKTKIRALPAAAEATKINATDAGLTEG